MHCKVVEQLKINNTNFLNGDILNISENFLADTSVEVVSGEVAFA